MQNLRLARLYLILLAIFVVGRWILGVKGLPYERGNPIFSIVSMTLISSVFYGAFMRRWGRSSILRGMALGFTLGIIGQLAIMAATAFSYHLNVDTYFNDPIALTGSKLEKALGFSDAMARRFAGLIVNSIANAIAGALGWVFGAALPEKP